MTKPARSRAYRWRPSPKLQAALEAAAKADRTSIDAILTRLVREWLAERDLNRKRSYTDQAARAALMVCAGIYKGDGTSATNERVRQVMGEYLEAKLGRHRAR